MKKDPRRKLEGWLGERHGMAVNTVLYNQPLSLTHDEVRALVEFRVCRASHENVETGHVVHCLEQEGHLGMHRAGYSWPACPEPLVRYGVRYQCIRPEHHKGPHDFGGRGVNFDWGRVAHV